MIRGLDQVKKKLNLGSSDESEAKKAPSNRRSAYYENPEFVPMMYRAQISGRCSLQFAGKKDNNKPTDLEKWTEEWVFANPDDTEKKPHHQLEEPQLGLDGNIYRVKLDFPWRVFTNCGQDSILRPVIGKKGIPFIPGSSIKGLFSRACSDEEQKRYCGTTEKPGILRFHGAYPVGDWSGARRVNFWYKGKEREEVRYRMVDVVHPQQSRQVQGQKSSNAIAQISLYRPTLVFEFSCTDPHFTDWKRVESKLKTAIRIGLGGKTSTGYGLKYYPKQPTDYDFSVYLTGRGVSPTLRSDEPEFRPNLFKATLRGHTSRLLAGVGVEPFQSNKLFGSSSHPSVVDLYFDYKAQDEWDTTYQVKGPFLIGAPQKYVELMKWVFKFTYTMGGFGKSWRRVYHGDFYRDGYDKEIGCHWLCEDSGIKDNDISEWITSIKSNRDLKKFLSDLENRVLSYPKLFSRKSQPSLDVKEAWHKDRVAVYAGKKVSDRSKAIDLFHNPTFKTTPAIGGRQPGDNRPTNVSSVWHRMLPVGNGQYLEIVTVFHGGSRSDWKGGKQNEDQLPSFIGELENRGLTRTWGKKPT